ncbi:MAG: 5'-nucleotidase, lipoprotein e(P4) family [Flavobacteriales bacterium]|jgi:5'-nucleotidase (lipoprotein e(P4) family)|nr:MAG: 5'-nucleotidase, lipoprotein e(P4) family [Flavobacteriales bacterium]
MRDLLLLVPLTALVACSGPRPTASSTPAADPTRELALMGSDAVLWQNASAEAYWIYEQAYEQAATKLMWNIVELAATYGEGQPRKPMAVIVDIDETVLDNSPYQVEAIEHGRTFDPQDWRAWTDKAIARPSPGALEFLLHAHQASCEVFYITNRETAERASTLKNLIAHGFPNADEAHLLLMDGTSDKTERRARVRATHDVVLLAGDQLRDFDERFKDRSVNSGKATVDALADSLSKYFILLPNPMYGTYRDAVQGKGTEAEKHARMKEWFQRNGH